MKNLIKKILKEEYGDKNNDLKKFIIDSIFFEDEPNVKDDEKLNKGFERFLDEYGFMVNRYGIKKSFIEYLQGLPSWLDIPYYYTDIENLLYSMGFDEVRDMDDEKLSKYWYDLISNIFLKR